MTEIKTHLKINQDLCGIPQYTDNGKSRVHMNLTKEMAADDKGLIHGGFIFGLADYAAMIAVNHPNVVLAESSCKFLKPSVTGDKLIAKAEVTEEIKNKRIVFVEVFLEDAKVFEGTFKSVIPSKHVLDK